MSAMFRMRGALYLEKQSGKKDLMQKSNKDSSEFFFQGILKYYLNLFIFGMAIFFILTLLRSSTPVNKNSISYRSTTKVKLFFYAFIFLRNIFFASLPSAFPQINLTSKKPSSNQRAFLFAVLVALAGESVLHLQVRRRKLTIKSLVSSPSCSLKHLHRVK